MFAAKKNYLATSFPSPLENIKEHILARTITQKKISQLSGQLKKYILTQPQNHNPPLHIKCFLYHRLEHDSIYWNIQLILPKF